MSEPKKLPTPREFKEACFAYGGAMLHGLDARRDLEELEDIYVFALAVIAEKDAEIARLKDGMKTAPRMECPRCKQLRDDVAFAEDPYASEINDDHEPVWQCGECSYQSTMDI